MGLICNLNFLKATLKNFKIILYVCVGIFMSMCVCEKEVVWGGGEEREIERMKRVWEGEASAGVIACLCRSEDNM